MAPYSDEKPLVFVSKPAEEDIDDTSVLDYNNLNFLHYDNLKPVSNEYDSDLIVMLDIDETMIKSQTFDSQKEAYKYAKRNSSLDYVQVPMQFFHRRYPSSRIVHINLRPGLKQFVEKIATTFETHIFTAGGATYAKGVARLLDPNGIYFKKIWSQEHCQKEGDGFVKHLSKLPLGRSDLKRVVLLDDNIDNLKASMGNVLSIKEFKDNPKDKELKKAQKFLLNELKDNGTDVQPILEAKAMKENSFEIMFQKIFNW